MSVKLQSGSFKGTKQQLKQKVAQVVFSGSLQGMFRAINVVQPNLAQKTGRFRTAFAMASQEVIQEQVGRTQIRINVDDIATKMRLAVPYAQYHIDRGPYSDPSTAGTAPLDTDELDRVARREIKQAVFDNFRAAGLEFLINR